MECKNFQEQFSAYIDNELQEMQVNKLEQHVSQCKHCRQELEKLQSLSEKLDTLGLAMKYDRAVDSFEHHVYNRIERGLVWIFYSIAGILLLSSGIFYFIRDFLFDTSQPIILRTGLSFAILGTVILLINVMRQRIWSSKKDPYKEVER